MNLQEVIHARSLAAEKISWCSIFIRAYSLVSARHPELRRAYIPFPWPHFYEHPCNVASFSIEKDHEGEKGVFFAQIFRPEHMSLLQLDRQIKSIRQAPLEEIPSFQSALRLSRLPRPLRRFIWWLGLDTDGAVRAQMFGTFGISVVAALGAASLHLLSPLTTTLNYGVFDQDGSLDVRLLYDHRVMDGGFVARAMVELEDILRGTIVQELYQVAEQENWNAASCEAA